jgi:hypothetical protein
MSSGYMVTALLLFLGCRLPALLGAGRPTRDDMTVNHDADQNPQPDVPVAHQKLKLGHLQQAHGLALGVHDSASSAHFAAITSPQYSCEYRASGPASHAPM